MRLQALKGSPRWRRLPHDLGERQAGDIAPTGLDRGSQYSSEQFKRVMADPCVVCSTSRSGNVWVSAAMGSFLSSLKTEPPVRKQQRTRDDARADVFDYGNIERFFPNADTR